MAKLNKTFVIWQWNCASFHRKKAVLQQFVSSQENKPAVILLQETLKGEVALRGYRSVACWGEGKRGVATLISKEFSFEVRDVRPDLKVEHILIELIPNSRLKEHLFILNVYSSPSDTRETFNALLCKASKIAGSAPLTVAGDFNAQHQTWGYINNTAKGRALLQHTTNLNMLLVTDHNFPTRLGNSVARDTTPDLAFVRNVECPFWQNLHENLGSDHFIASISLDVKAPPPRVFKIVDWDAFRELRQSDEEEYDDLGQLLERLKADVKAATKVVETDLKTERMDSRLARLLEAKNSLLNRWRTQRLNRRLRKKIALLKQEIESYSQTLARQQWDEVCNAVDGQMRSGAKWNILKHLLGDKQTKANQKHTVDRLIHKERSAGLSNDQILQQLADRYLPLGATTDADYPDFSGLEDAELDSPFNTAEIRAVLFDLNGKSAPGPDGITNRLLKNLDDRSIELLTDEVNRVWESGQVPKEWRTASVVLIPKPGKPLGLGTLRPISLTSCVGKVAEHAILNRISHHIEQNELFPFNLIGFRPALSTQDVMKMIKHQILDIDTRDVRGILALDLEKAFDNISHPHILDSISELGLGARFYGFVRSFLRDRVATIRLGDLCSKEFHLGPRGTPQGSVISPLIFNIAMRKLSLELSRIDRIGHALYADDITIWCTGGRDGDVEESLQQALRCTEEFLDSTGLHLSTAKSELLLYTQPEKRKFTTIPFPPEEIRIEIHTRSGQAIPRVDKIRILGMFLEEHGSNSHTLTRIAAKAESMVKLILRVSNRRGGLCEANLMRLFHAFLMSHINYIAAAHRWERKEQGKLDAIIRKCIKRVLGLPNNTNEEKLKALGMHNTFSEIAEAQQTAQAARLSSSKAGRRILEFLGCEPTMVADKKIQLPPKLREQITVSQIPRNVHPLYNVGRRAARARSLLSSAAATPELVAFVDAAQYPGTSNFVAVVTDLHGKILTAASLRDTTPARAEQAAIAMAVAIPMRTRIFTDSRAAARAFMTGSVCEQAAHLLTKRPHCTEIDGHITWFPAHMGKDVHPVIPNANELAHARARELSHRDGQSASNFGDGIRQLDSLLTFNEICKNYQLARRSFPLPHPQLSRAQSVTLRMLQTGTYPSPLVYSKFIDSIKPQCPHCEERRCTLPHMLWQCAALRDGEPLSTEAAWRTAITSSDREVQIRAVQRARNLAEGLALPVPTWVRPAADPPS